MSSNSDNRIFLLIGSIIGFLGAAAVIVGAFIEYNLINVGIPDVFGLVIITLIAGIFTICLLNFLGGVTPQGLIVNDERPGLIALSALLFFPSRLFGVGNTPIFYLLNEGNIILGSGPGFGFYLVNIGIAALYVAFFVYLWNFFWKNRLSTTGGLNLSGGSTEIGFVKILKIITAIFAIAGSVGIIFGILLPVATGTLPEYSILMSGTGTQLDLTALAMLVLVTGIGITAVLYMLGNFGILKQAKSGSGLMMLIVILGLIPGYEVIPFSAFWSSPMYEMILLNYITIVTPTISMNIWGWFSLIGVLALILAFLLGSVSFFFSKSASFVARTRTPRTKGEGKLEARKKRGKFPTKPPSAPVSSSGPPSISIETSTGAPALSGPSSAMGNQPTITSSPPTPPSFMSTTSAASASAKSDDPTCPFCGKGLRYIDEYSRWYCDSCSQYV